MLPFRPTLPPVREFTPMFQTPQTTSTPTDGFAAAAHLATAAATQTSADTYRSDVEGLIAERNAGRDEVRMARTYRSAAHDTLEAALRMFEAAEAAAAGDLAAAAALRRRAEIKIAPIAAIGRRAS